MNHKVVCGDDREIFVTIMEGSLELDLILRPQFEIKLRKVRGDPQASNHYK